MGPATPEPDEGFLEALRREEEEERDRQIADTVEAWKIHKQNRPDWWTPRDAEMALTLSEKPEGFLADDQLWRRGNVGQIFGPPDTFKTWVMAFAGGQVARGLAVLGIPSRQAEVLILSEEMDNPSIMERCVQLWSKEERNEILDSLAFSYDSNMDFFARTKESQKKLEYIIKTTNSPKLIFIDAASNIHTGDENSNRDMGLVFGAIKDVAKVTGTNIQVLHHLGSLKEGQTDPDKGRGATAVRAVCSDMISVMPKRSASGQPQALIRWKKHRFLKPQNRGAVRPVTFQLDPHPQYPDRSVVTVDRSDVAGSAEVNPEHIEQLVTVVESLAGSDGEVLRAALVSTLMDGRGWGRRRLDETLSAAVRIGRVGRMSRGKEAVYYIPRGGVDEVSGGNGPTP